MAGRLPFPVVATLVGVGIGLVILVVLWPLGRRAARLDGDPATGRLVRWGLVLKLVAVPVYLLVVSSVYGSGDYSLYSHNGALIAHAYRSGQFHVVLPAASSQDNFVSFVAGWIYTVVGVTQLGAFFVFAGASFCGQYLCYRAFRVAVPDGDRVRYGRLMFLFPSVVFWTVPIGKDSLSLLGLGLAFLGTARLFRHRRGGLVLLGAGLGLTMAVRPNIALTVFVALAPAYVVARGPRRGRGNVAAKVVGVAALVIIGSLVIPRAEHFLGIKNLSLNAVNGRLKQVATDTTNAGSASLGTTGASTSSPTIIDDPWHLPQDVVTVLFRPFPTEAPTAVTRLASLESLFLLGLSIVSFRRMGAAVRQVGRNGLVGFALFYALVFLATFAAIGNLGLLARERVQVLPAWFVLLAAAAPAARRLAAPNRAAPATSRPGPVRLGPVRLGTVRPGTVRPGPGAAT